MSELTDLEICKRIAEIEGLESAGGNPHRIHIEVNGNKRTMQWNPLGDCAIDKALCFDLMVKHHLMVEVMSDVTYASHSEVFDPDPYVDTSTNKAICMAVIKGHEGDQHD